MFIKMEKKKEISQIQLKQNNTSKYNDRINNKIWIQNKRLLFFLIIMINIPLFKFDDIKIGNKKYIKEKNKYLDNCFEDDIYKYDYNNICYTSCPKNSMISLSNKYLCIGNISAKFNQNKDSNTKIIHNYDTFRKLNYENEDKIIKNIRNNIVIGKLDSEINDLINGNGTDIFFFENNIAYHITTTENQNNLKNINNNVSNILLGECENIIKDYYNVAENATILMLKFDYYKKDMLVPITEYELYDYKNRQVFQLILCRDIKVKMMIPLLNEDEKDICINLCDDNCEYLGYDSDNKKYICLCPIKTKMNLISNITIQKWNSIGYYDKFCQIESNDNDINDLSLKDELIKNIKEEIKSGALDKLLKELLYGNGEDIIINKTDVICQITTPENQYLENYTNLSTIKLGECEDILRNIYNIDISIPLFIFKVDYYKENSSVPIVEYEVYESKTNKPLNLSYCKDVNLDIEIPVVLNENILIKYDSSSQYYKDSCYTYTTDKGTDIILKDRKKEFINNKLFVCEENCLFQGYDSSSKKALCECETKTNFSLISEIYDIKNKLMGSFSEFKKTNIFKCVDLFFSKEGLKDNKGSYILLGIIGLNFILIIVMFKGGKDLIQNQINKILKVNYETISDIENNCYINNNKQNFNDNNNNNGNNSNNSNNNKIENNNSNINENSIEKNNKVKMIEENSKNTKIIQINDNPPKKLKMKQGNCNDKKETVEIIENPDSKIEFKNIDKSKFNDKKPVIDISLLNKNKNNGQKQTKINDIQFSPFNEYELNKLRYKDALSYDKRSYFKYYFSIVKRNNLLIFAFLLSNDYNPKVIKISIFSFSIALYFTMNVAFSNDSVMHVLYEKEGSFELDYQMPYIIYSIIISAVVIGIIKFIFLSEKDIMQIRKVKEKEYINGKTNKIINYVKCKFILLFILTFLLLFFFWIYVGLFCAVFKNSQIYLIKKTAISYAFYLLYPFFFCSLTAFLRIISLKSPNRACLYKFSNILQNI